MEDHETVTLGDEISRNNQVDEKSDFVKRLEELSGREFTDDESAAKHYKNLSSFVGKKAEINEDLKREAEALKAETEKYKSFFKDLGKNVEEVNPFELQRLVGAMKPRTAVDPTPALPNNDEKIEQLGRAAMKGNRDAATALVEQVLGLQQNVNSAEKGQAERMDNLRYK